MTTTLIQFDSGSLGGGRKRQAQITFLHDASFGFEALRRPKRKGVASLRTLRALKYHTPSLPDRETPTTVPVAWPREIPTP